jgi:transcriptional regulator GlxA family with amidase domain
MLWVLMTRFIFPISSRNKQAFLPKNTRKNFLLKNYMLFSKLSIPRLTGYVEICFVIQTTIKKNNNMTKQLIPGLPTVGVLVFDGVLSNEVVAPVDVFSKADASGKKLFNVVVISKDSKPCLTEEGLTIIPDCTTADAPGLNVLVVPGSMNPEDQVNDETLIRFIKKENETTDYTVSHCAGAFILGASGVADNKKIVTYCGGSKSLQDEFPKLLVQNDNIAKVVQDGKIISSNGNLVSYLGSLDLLEKMTSKEHRLHVEQELLLHKLN